MGFRDTAKWLGAVIALSSHLALADAASESAAGRLLDLMEMDTLFADSMSQMMDVQLQQMPSLLPYKHVLLQFLQKHMSYESLKHDLIKLYGDAFTAAELQELADFYGTDVGRKTVRLMPDLMAAGAQMGSQRVQQNVGELQQMIRDEAQRLRDLQQQGS